MKTFAQFNINEAKGNVADKFYNAIQSKAGWYCMDNKEDKAKFKKWLTDNCSKFELDAEKAIKIISKNDSWCTDNDEDMGYFIKKAFGIETKEYKDAVENGFYEEEGWPAIKEDVVNEFFASEAKMICMSHLSDVQELVGNNADVLNRLNFVKKIIIDTKGDLTQIIDPDALWKEFEASKFFRK